MKNLFLISTTLFLFFQAFGFSQDKKLNTSAQKKIRTTEIDTTKLADFIGTYYLAEADLNLEITVENNIAYVVTSFSKDELIFKNETTLTEVKRIVDLTLIEDDENALQYTQNGYVTTIKRMDPKK